MGSVAKLGALKDKARVGGSALESLLEFIEERGCRAGAWEEGFEAFEREVHRRFAEAERELVGEELARLGCGTLSHYDGAGERLRTRRHARLPEPGKRSLKRQLVAEVEHALNNQPQLRLVKVADGARENWEFLAKELPPGEEVVDFYHAAEHLRRAFGQVYGEASPKALASFEEYRHLLLKAEDGVGKVIRTLAYITAASAAARRSSRNWSTSGATGRAWTTRGCVRKTCRSARAWSKPLAKRW